MKKIIIILLLLIITVGLYFYVVLSGKITNATTKQPYANFMNKVLLTKREITLAKNLPEFCIKEKYFITEDKELFEGVEKITVLPKETKITFINAFHYKNGTSGVTQSILIGKTWVESLKKEIFFEYSWGDFHSICIDQPCDYWTFPLGIWQEEPNDKKYFIK